MGSAYTPFMMKRLYILLVSACVLVLLGIGAKRYFTPATNPDPNHTHADFAVWIGGKELDFSDKKYMSGLSTDANHDNEEGLRKYLHLHDGNGHVMHRHKPGLSVGDFFGTIGFSFGSVKRGEFCWYALSADHPFAGCESGPMRLFVNGNEASASENGPAGYVFADGDHLLFTDATDETEVKKELDAMTDDACKYSKMCPWKGAPPTENCIADPTVPCVVQ